MLRVISGSPGELEPVFQAMLENATRICEAKFGNLWMAEAGGFVVAATHGVPAKYRDRLQRGVVYHPGPTVPVARAAATRQPVHIPDLRADAGYLEREPIVTTAVELGQIRTIVVVPLLKDRQVVGAFAIYRQEVRPFTDKQIALVQNFAAQAVIAIENSRLLNELRQSLEQQTAMAEVLGVISSSPGEIEPVFETVLANATRLCEANFGVLQLCEDGGFRMVAMHNPPPAYAESRRRQPVIHPGPLTPPARVAATKQLLHVADLTQEEAYKVRDPSSVRFVETAGVRTLLVVPMLKENELIGEISVYRQEVRPFTDRQIALLQNFAAQAVIAIENTRLLNELRQSLEQQTATADVLRVISSSPGELEPVFTAMLENATRICDAKFGIMTLYEGGSFRAVALHNAPPEFAEARRREPLFSPAPNNPLARVAATKETLQIPDLRLDESYLSGEQATIIIAERGGARTLIDIPMLKDGELVGVFGIYRQEVRPFTDKQIELLQNFAAQAVIAIENTRLLNELRQRTDDLSESLEQQTATSEVLQVISSSPGELEPVFQAMLENATRICEAKFGALFRYDGRRFDPLRDAERAAQLMAISSRQRGRVFAGSRSTLSTAFCKQESWSILTIDVCEPIPTPVGQTRAARGRTIVSVPMLKDDELIGAIAIYRQEVRPFTDKQIELVQNFAAQAVIAIENTRLLNELRQRTDDLTEALEQQTTTAEILGVISKSLSDTQPVFDAIVQSGVRLFSGAAVSIALVENGMVKAAAVAERDPVRAELWRQRFPFPLTREYMHSVAILDRKMLDIPNVEEAPADMAVGRKNFLGSGYRAATFVPLMRGETAIGALSVVRVTTGPLSEKQLAALKTYASQAVIAIENTRLLNELRQRTDDLTESLEQQTATADVLRVISSSPGDLQPVFDAMLENATRICGANSATVSASTTARTARSRCRTRLPEYLDGSPGRSACDHARRSGHGQRGGHQKGRSDRRPGSRPGYRRRATPPFRRHDRRTHIRQRADAQGRRDRRRHRVYRAGSAPVHRQADCAGTELRRPGRDRHREHAAAQRIAAIAGAADGDRGCAQGHQPLDIRPADGARHADRVRPPGFARPIRASSFSATGICIGWARPTDFRAMPRSTRSTTRSKRAAVARLGASRWRARSFISPTCWPIPNTARLAISGHLGSEPSSACRSCVTGRRSASLRSPATR